LFVFSNGCHTRLLLSRVLTGNLAKKEKIIAVE
jgi:hypothetical protein